MASNPGFVTGQIPTAAQWNSYFTGKADIVFPNLSKTGNYTVLSSDVQGGFLVIFASSDSAGISGITITIPTSLGSSSNPFIVVLNTGVLGYPIYISDGTRVMDEITTAASDNGRVNGYLMAYPMATTLFTWGSR